MRGLFTAGVSPSQAPVETILKVDLYGTSVLLEEFGKVIAGGGSGIVISSQSGKAVSGRSFYEKPECGNPSYIGDFSGVAG